MIEIELNNVRKSYGNNLVIPGVNLLINKGERLVLLGPSGCGKSTLLRIIAGFESISSGEVKMGGQVVNGITPGKRNVAMVFQNYALYPHMTVEKNIIYGLEASKVSKNVINERLNDVLKYLELEKYRNRKPHEMSGGQRQRVALARATVKHAPCFLLDEPLSNLDAQLRIAARQSLLNIHQKYRQTMIYVTHDQIEAMTFATKIALINHGEIQMYDTPYNVYHYPRNIFTARFIGNPPMNILKNVEIGQGCAQLNGQVLALHDEWTNYLSDQTTYTMGIRPENVVIETTDVGRAAYRATVNYIENQGANYAVYLTISDQRFVSIVKYVDYSVGDTVYVRFLEDHLHFFDAQSEENIGRPEGFKWSDASGTEGFVEHLN